MKGDTADDLAWPFKLISGIVNGFTACITDEMTRCLQSVQNAATRLLTGNRRCNHLSCTPPAALASRAAVRHVQAQNLYRRRIWKFCSSRFRLSSTSPCPATPGLPGRRLSARRRRPCQTTAFYRHSNTRCQSDSQQFWRQDLCRRS